MGVGCARARVCVCVLILFCDHGRCHTLSFKLPSIPESVYCKHIQHKRTRCIGAHISPEKMRMLHQYSTSFLCSYQVSPLLHR